MTANLELVRALSVEGLREIVSEFGGDLDVLACEIGLGPLAALDSQHFIATRKTHELLNLAAERLKRPDLGLIWGARSDPTRLGPLHVALANARTGREAIEILIRFLHLNFPAGEVRLTQLRDGRSEFLGLRSLLHRPPPLIQFHERRVATLHVILKGVCGPRYSPQAIWFTHECVSPPRTYTSVFGLQPVFGAPENGIVLTSATLDAERVHANEQVREMAVSFLRAREPPANKSSVFEATHMVRGMMRKSDCTASEIARALSINTRTLQRRLEREGSSFETIKDEVRKEMTAEMLTDPSLSITDIALALHYENVSSFTRSCRRWFGAPPSQLRRRGP